MISAIASMVIISFVRYGVHMEFSSNGYTTTARRSAFIGRGGAFLHLPRELTWQGCSALLFLHTSILLFYFLASTIHYSRQR
jgi:hypothetical protein